MNLLPTPHPSPHAAIRCLLQSTGAHAGLRDVVPPPGLLAPAEVARFDALKTPKRRDDWLLGRWTAKHLVRNTLSEAGAVLDLDGIMIAADDDGAPYAALLSATGAVERLPLSLSISHSGDRSFCAVTARGGATVGADVEAIEPRQLAFVEQFFTQPEIDAVAGLEDGSRHRAVTLVWSAKEAVLKTLRMGLRADTRQVECLPVALQPAPYWAPVPSRVDPELLAGRDQPLVWGHVNGDFVLTVALLVGG